MTKMTYVDAINIALEAIADEEVKEKLEALKGQISKKRSSSNSKAKQETALRAEKVYNAFAEMSEPVTISQMLKLTSDADVADYSVSRVSALIRNLNKEEERIVKTVEKGKALFSVK